MNITNKKDIKTNNKKSQSIRKRSKKKSKLFFRRWPSWWLWSSVVVAVLIYVFAFYHFFITPYSFRWRAFYGTPVYPEGYDIRGIDISHHQGVVDWERLRNVRIKGVPISFVFIKATEGCTLEDENFHHNFSRARMNEITRGAYHYFKPETDVLKQARFFIRNVALEPGDLPPVLDVEEVGTLSTDELQKAVKLWLNIVEKKYGVKPIIYTGRSFKESYLKDSYFDAYPLWLAHYYVDKVSYTGKWYFWQHTDVGEVDGIRGKVDCNIFNGTRESFDSLLIKRDNI